eukprot:4753673-Prymnesium_polylepis.1
MTRSPCHIAGVFHFPPYVRVRGPPPLPAPARLGVARHGLRACARVASSKPVNRAEGLCVLRGQRRGMKPKAPRPPRPRGITTRPRPRAKRWDL